MKKERRAPKGIEVKVGEHVYYLIYESHSFTITRADKNSAYHNYPATLNRALQFIVDQEILNGLSEKTIGLKEYIEKYESLVNQVLNADFKVIEKDIRHRPGKKSESIDDSEEDIF